MPIPVFADCSLMKFSTMGNHIDFLVCQEDISNYLKMFQTFLGQYGNLLPELVLNLEAPMFICDSS
jgi:hypothetical protein